MRTKLIKFTVEGRGCFPFDMLRYDRCYPESGDDAAKLTFNERRRVTLIGQGLTKGRWQSFGWPVIEQKTIII